MVIHQPYIDTQRRHILFAFLYAKETQTMRSFPNASVGFEEKYLNS